MISHPCWSDTSGRRSGTGPVTWLAWTHCHDASDLKTMDKHKRELFLYHILERRVAKVLTVGISNISGASGLRRGVLGNSSSLTLCENVCVLLSVECSTGTVTSIAGERKPNHSLGSIRRACLLGSVRVDYIFCTTAQEESGRSDCLVTSVAQQSPVIRACPQDGVGAENPPSGVRDLPEARSPLCGVRDLRLFCTRVQSAAAPRTRKDLTHQTRDNTAAGAPNHIPCSQTGAHCATARSNSFLSLQARHANFAFTTPLRPILWPHLGRAVFVDE